MLAGGRPILRLFCKKVLFDFKVSISLLSEANEQLIVDNFVTVQLIFV